MAEDMKITVGGIPRSGSTLVWQLISEVFPKVKIGKTHPAAWEPDGSFIIVTIRNPYDVGASRFRHRTLRDQTGLVNIANLAGLDAELNEMIKHFAPLTAWVKELPEMALLRYEDFYNNYDLIFDLIEERLNKIVPMALRDTIKDKFSLDKNRKRCAQPVVKGENRFRMGPGHIGTVTPGLWRSIIPPWGYELMAEKCGPVAKEWGYETGS